VRDALNPVEAGCASKEALVLLNVVAGVAVISLSALVAALLTGSVGAGWFTVGASVVGIVLLIVNELSERGREAGESDADSPRANEELRYNRHLLLPDIWPIDRPAPEPPDDPETVRPQAGPPLRPDIWP
jgi:hypothetical protein